jgi:CRISPR system Cascade subunit CasB
LARLRRSQPGNVSDPASWSVVFGGTPAELVGRGEDPSRAEMAVHAALVLFAGHAQSADGPRHVRGRRLGHAIGDLARADDPEGYADGAVARRFRSFASATTWTSAVRHLRGLISLMRSHRVALDYGVLAADLWRMQDPQGLRRVRLQWARDFHHLPSRSTAETPSTASTEQEI